MRAESSLSARWETRGNFWSQPYGSDKPVKTCQKPVFLIYTSLIVDGGWSKNPAVAASRGSLSSLSLISNPRRQSHNLCHENKPPRYFCRCSVWQETHALFAPPYRLMIFTSDGVVTGSRSSENEISGVGSTIPIPHMTPSVMIKWKLFQLALLYNSYVKVSVIIACVASIPVRRAFLHSGRA